MRPDINTISLYTLSAVQQPGLAVVQTSSVASLLAVSHAIEAAVARHGIDAIFFAGFQRFSAFLPQAGRFEALAARCRKVYVFGQADSAMPAIPNLEYVPLQPGAALADEWFIVVSHPSLQIALLTREAGHAAAGINSDHFGRGRLYQGIITLEAQVVQPAADLLHAALGIPPAPVPPPAEPVHPLNTYINHFARAMERAQGQLTALVHSLSERARSLERLEGIVRTMVSRRAWDDSLQMLAQPGEQAFQPERRSLTILFTDIQNFTPLFDRQDPGALTDLLNRYFDLLATIIYAHHGDIDKFLGDGLMAFFTDPAAAVRAAAAMQRRLAAFNTQQSAHLGLQLNTRIGIASGECLITRIGSAARREITVIGDAVNLASRLQAIAPAQGAGLDESTYRAIGSPAAWIGREVQVKGMGSQRMYSANYEILAAMDQQPPQGGTRSG